MTLLRAADVFVFGTHIYRFPSLPLDDLKRDMQTIKHLGFNTFKIQESWSVDNPREREVNLSEVESLIIEAERAGLLVYLGVTMEQVPAWIWRKFPDCRLVDASGHQYEDPTQYVLPCDGQPGACWYHPGLREVAKQFMATLASTLGKYENIVVWNAWQEVRQGGYLTERPHFCYCTHTLARFRTWLREKYGTLTNLNRTWRTSFGEWDEVDPPRRFTAVPSFIDWKYFMSNVYLSEVLKWKASVLRDNDPLHRPVLAHSGGARIGSEMDWNFAKSVDIFGRSCYPGMRGHETNVSEKEAIYEEMWRESMSFDYMKNAAEEKECWAAEFQGGLVRFFLFQGLTPRPEDIRRWLMLALAGGMQGISFWNFRPDIFWYEGHGFGLCDGKGNPTDRAKEAGMIGKKIQHWSSIFKQAKAAKHEVAILVNENLYDFLVGSGKDEDFKTEVTKQSMCDHLSYSISGIYKTLWELGIWPDFVRSEDLVPEKLDRYKLAFLPFPLAMSDEYARHLRNYVQKGGVLVSEACPGRFNGYGLANLSGFAAPLEGVFGVEEKTVIMCQDWGEPKWWSIPFLHHHGDFMPPAVLKGIGPLSETSTRGCLWLELYTPKSAVPALLWENEVAGTVNSFGKGKAYLFGTFFGHSPVAYNDSETKALIAKILRQAQIEEERFGKLLRKRWVTEEDEAWFLFNPTSEIVVETLDMSGFTSANDLLDSNSVSVNQGKIKVLVEPLSIRCVILMK